MKKTIKTSLYLLSIGFLISVIFQACSIKPASWTPSPMPEFTDGLTKNELLKSTEPIDLDGWFGPEDIAVDKAGNLYCGVHIGRTDFDDGRILKIAPNGKVSTFCNTESAILGLHFDKDENLIACDMERGLISVNPNGKITTLAGEDENGNKFLIPNDVDIASDGMIYFTITSSKYDFSLEITRKIILEAKPDGGLYQYNPKTKAVKTLIDGSYFGNGVAVSQDDSFVLMVDLTKYRVIKYHLKGTKKGQTEVFVENLPGFPNGISRRADGSFWIGFSTIRDATLDKIHPKPFMKKIVYGLPKFMQPKQKDFGIVMHISEGGEILKTLYDTSGKAVSEASSVEEHEGFIYLGGDLKNHIGKYKLK